MAEPVRYNRFAKTIPSKGHHRREETVPHRQLGRKGRGCRHPAIRKVQWAIAIAAHRLNYARQNRRRRGSIGRKTIETILLLSTEEVDPHTSGKASGDIVWHGSQDSRVALADRQLKVKRPRLRHGGAAEWRFHPSIRGGSAGDGGHRRGVAQ